MLSCQNLTNQNLTCQNLTIFSPECCPETDQPLLKDISFSAMPGAMLYIVGPNGSGKTSLLKTLAGLRRNYQGSIILPESKNNAKVYNYIGHQNAIKKDLTVADNLNYWASATDGQNALLAVTRYLQLEPLLEKKCSTLSQGMQKKLSLSRLMLSQAPLWLLDEVDTNLDAQNLAILNNLIKAKLSCAGIVLMSTHNSKLAPKCQKLNLEDFY